MQYKCLTRLLQLWTSLLYHVVFLQPQTLARKNQASTVTHVIKSEVINNVISVYILQNQFGCLRCHPRLLIADRAAVMLPIETPPGHGEAYKSYPSHGSYSVISWHQNTRRGKAVLPQWHNAENRGRYYTLERYIIPSLKRSLLLTSGLQAAAIWELCRLIRLEWKRGETNFSARSWDGKFQIRFIAFNVVIYLGRAVWGCVIQLNRD